MAKMNEKAPKGWEKSVKSMKKNKDIDNPYALSWWMKNKGYKHGKSAKESCDIDVWHPDYGQGTLVEFDQKSATIHWGSPHWNIERGYKLTMTEAKAVILPRFAKYSRITPLSEETIMENEMMSMKDYISLMEADEPLTVPDQSSTILTGAKAMKTTKSEPLTTIDKKAKDNGPYDEKGTFSPKDAMDAPKVKTNKLSGKSGVVKGADLKLGKDTVTEMEDEIVVSGDVSMTTEFLTKLLNAASEASITSGDVNKIVDAIEDSFDGEALGIEDIAKVMDALRDVSECDKENGDGKKAKDGKTQLMDDDDDLTEAFIVPMPQAMTSFSEKPDYTGLTEDEIEIEALKRLSGLTQ